jgi:hypothetical protein
MARRAQKPVAAIARLGFDPNDRKRLLALDIRSSKVGFAVFEGPTKLLDWGVRWFVDGTLRSTVTDRISTLLTFHTPFAVVVRGRKYYSPSKNRRFATIVSSIRAETRRNSTKLRIITTRQVHDHFDSHGRATKHFVATIIARHFEELSWKLPHRRKSYESEAPTMVIFDAVANGIVFFGGPTFTNAAIQDGS